MIDRRSLLRAAAGAAGVGLARIDASAQSGQSVPSPSLRLQRLTWAGIRLQLDTATLFVDPLTNKDVWGPALSDPLIPVGDAQGARFVLVTHRHPDHCDPATIQQALGDSGTLVYPVAAGPPTIPGVKMRAAAPYEPLILGDFTATPVPAVDGYGDPQVSWIVSAGGRRVIHCGDTLWHGMWWQIGRQFGPFDVACLPINGARFAWRQPISDIPAVMTPEQAVAAAVVLDARRIVPIHYGVLGAQGYTEVATPESALHDAARKRQINVDVLRPGSWLSWGATRSFP